ncbi:zinc-binding dehydrogenase [Achromobacter sp. GG226]|uniref:zinc-binding dehydrogenase n=1 Tax=Verticiella alkaliphila TaxID=2779529 RepID=UPI001C0D109B|nr:zinc-binding dehydrogenase [Verticiella sp. GG226]MBU4612328.1 zinc-binding dehydrogenase [Verticiella sp. GG226]
MATSPLPETTQQLQSRVDADGTLTLHLAEVPVAPPADDEVVVRVEAAPINPSDMGLLFGGADLSALQASGTPEQPVLTGRVPERALPAMAGRIGKAMPVGNEGGGVVVAAGSSPQAQALLGRTVGVMGGAMYTGYRTVKANACLPLPDGTSSAQAASCFVNPLTSLGMVETMRAEGHTALVHTAAASNLGQMLNRICQKDGVSLVNIVRKPEQAALLREQGATWVCDSSAEDFTQQLIEALSATGATIAFDAIGGGRLASDILAAMETVAVRSQGEYSRYGSTVLKQVYLYGSLDRGPTQLHRSYGMAWNVGGWLLMPFLQKAGRDTAARLRQRVADEITTTFASHYQGTVSLAEALSLRAIGTYGKAATGTKYLINPSA